MRHHYEYESVYSDQSHTQIPAYRGITNIYHLTHVSGFFLERGLLRSDEMRSTKATCRASEAAFD